MRSKGRPFLGICVGAQLMAERGLEFRVTPGFGWIEGDVRAMEPKDPTLKVPHMGWNTLSVINDHPLLDGIETGPDGLHAYFVHSFHLVTPNRAALVAEADGATPIESPDRLRAAALAMRDAARYFAGGLREPTS